MPQFVSKNKIMFLSFALAIGVAPQFLNGQSTVTFVPGVSRIAGTGQSGSTGIGGSALDALLHNPYAAIEDPSGNIYVSDYTNNVVDRIDAATGIITIYAGGGTPCTDKATDAYGDGCLATQATLNHPNKLLLDSTGNLYIADLGDSMVREVMASTKIIVKVAGGGKSGAGQCSGSTDTVGDGCLATQANMSQPSGLAMNANGDIFVSDPGKRDIRRIDGTTGIITTYAGTGSAGMSADGGLANKSKINAAVGMTVDAAGNLYFADQNNDLVRLITAASGVVTTFAGTNGTTATPGYSGDGGAATSALLNAPSDVLLYQGNAYIADTGNSVIRLVNRDGNISTFAGGASTVCSSGDNLGNGCAVTQAQFGGPSGIASDGNGGFLIADTNNNQIRHVSLGNAFGSVAVNPSTPASQTAFAQANQAATLSSVQVATGSSEFQLSGTASCQSGAQLSAGQNCSLPISFAPKLPGVRGGIVSLADSSGAQYALGVYGLGTGPALAFSPSLIQTSAGTGTAGYKDGSAANSAQFNGLSSLVEDSSGNVYIADTGNNVIRRIDGATEAVSTIAGGGSPGYSGDGGPGPQGLLNQPRGVALDIANARLLIADTSNHAIRALSAQGILSTIAGTGTAGYSGDGSPATAAQLQSPSAVAADTSGNIYIADTGNNVVRRISSDGVINTVAGNGTAGHSGDGSAAISATLNAPSSLALDVNGNLYIADTGNHVIRKVTIKTGIITTVAGNGTQGYSGDGGAAISGELNAPMGISLDAAGDLYIADTGNHIVRFVSAATGYIATVAGSGVGGYDGDGSSATLAKLSAPSSVAVDGAGNLLIADTGNQVVRSVSQASSPSLNFVPQNPGTTSSPQMLTLTNVGNMPLSFTSIAATAPFTIAPNPSGDCSVGTALAAGASCTISVVFSPTSNGAASGTLTLADNSLNLAATQVVSLISTNPGLTTSTTLSIVPSTNPIIYGNTVTLTATITEPPANTNPYTGNVLFSDGSAQLGSVAPNTSGIATYSVTPIAGTHSYSAFFLGDSDHSASQSAAVSLTVKQATTTTTVTASGTTVENLTPVTLTATVAPQIGGMPTGTVTFYAGGSSIGTGTINSTGIATLTLSTLAAGANAITATYDGDNNFQASTSAALTITVVTTPDFSITTTPSAITIPAGQSGIVNITITPKNAYTGTISFACGSLPANVVCRFMPATITATGVDMVASTQLLITTGGNSTLQQTASAFHNSNPSLFALALVLFPLGWIKRRRGLRSRMMLALLIIVSASFLALAGCSNGYTKAPAASSGTSSITITATGSSGGIAHISNLTLIVQ